MADADKPKMVQMRWIVAEFESTWRESRDPQELAILLGCLTGFDRDLILTEMFWRGVTHTDWALADFCVTEGYPLNPTELFDWGPLHSLITLIGDRPDIAGWLIEHGADIERRGPSNRTPLHSACAAGYIGIVDLLIVAGADVDSRTEIDDNATPLMLAVAGNHPLIVENLLLKGADPTLRDFLGRSANEWGGKSSDAGIRRLLTNK